MSSDSPISRLKELFDRFLQTWLVRGVLSWIDVNGMRLSAAMAFYAMLSMAPLLVLVLAGLSRWMDRSALEETVLHQVQGIAGDRAATMIEQLMHSAAQPTQGLIATLIASGVLLFAATGVFVALQDSLKSIWGVDNTSDKPWWWLLVLRLRGIVYMIVLGSLLLFSMILSTVMRVLSSILMDVLPLSWLWSLLNEGVFFVIVTILFVGLMRGSDGRKPKMRYLIRGSLIGAVLFTLGKHAMAIYLSGAAVVSAYGAAGSLVALLMWLYFSSAILLLSASLAKAMADADEVPLHANASWTAMLLGQTPPASKAGSKDSSNPPENHHEQTPHHEAPRSS